MEKTNPRVEELKLNLSQETNKRKKGKIESKLKDIIAGELSDLIRFPGNLQEYNELKKISTKLYLLKIKILLFLQNFGN